MLAALQARNNARVVFSGSLEFFSDKFLASSVQKPVKMNLITYIPTERLQNSSDMIMCIKGGKVFEKSGNEALVKALSDWVFKEKGVLRLSNITHHKVGESEAPSEYTITEDVVYRAVIEELKDGIWTGYVADDVQLEFVRIDPFVRTSLKRVPGQLGLYESKFKIPDVYGVYQFKIDYHRKGYTFVNSATQVFTKLLVIKLKNYIGYERFQTFKCL